MKALLVFTSMKDKFINLFVMSVEASRNQRLCMLATIHCAYAFADLCTVDFSKSQKYRNYKQVFYISVP